jgi:hypothetical protein
MNLATSYLTERITEADVEAENDFKSSPDFAEDWERLIRKRQPGDELWRFAPPPGEIEIRGVALVRRGNVISTLVGQLVERMSSSNPAAAVNAPVAPRLRFEHSRRRVTEQGRSV